MSQSPALDAEAIRKRILDAKAEWPGGWIFPGSEHVLDDFASLRASEGKPWALRRGLRVKARLASIKFVHCELDLLAGFPAFDLSQRPRREGGSCPDLDFDEGKAYLSKLPAVGGQTGHCQPDFSFVMEHGLEGLARRVSSLRDASSEAKALTYESFLLALEGLKTMISNAAAAVEAAIPSASAERRDAMLEAVESCRWISARPPRGFRDALQLAWLICFGMMAADNASLCLPGRIDRWAFEPYRRDLAAGAVTREKALALVESLYFAINAAVPDGLAVAVMAGGRMPDGSDGSNELSFLCFEALRRTRLVYPTVGLAWHEGAPLELADLATDLIAQGYSTPAFFGDSVIQKGLASYGVPPSEAWGYVNSACVEITPCGASNIWVASPYFSSCGILLEEIDAELASGSEASSFESFLARYLARFSARIEQAAKEQNSLREGRRLYGGKPLQSLFTRDCVGRGLDIDEGGALYNWVECSFVGLANLADSLAVVREELFKSRRLSLPALKKILAANFEGYERERLRFLAACPKYGNACEEVDSLFRYVVERLVSECRRWRMEPDGSPFVPGAFCWIMHERLGSECGATPDGRKAGAPFADGGGPAQGREKAGPTSAILSTCSWDHSPLIGGVAFNMKFSKSLFKGSGSVERLRSLILSFLAQGGFEVQVNVIDRETLLKAKASPDKYRDLVVRIGGYTDYFARLSSGMQDELLLRAEYGGF